MRRRTTRRRWPRVVAGVVIVAVAVLFTLWRHAIHANRSIPDQPFRIAGNLYYVGSTGVTSFLLTGPDGDVLIDGGYAETAPLIIGSIRKLGFDIRDVKVLLNTHAHADHAGGLRELQQASGAQLWVSEGDAKLVATGGAWDRGYGPLRFLGFGRFPPARVDHVVKDGDVVRVGPIAVTAHITPGHTPGCTTWSFPVRDGGRELLAVDVCSLSLLPFMSRKDSVLRAEFERSFRVLRSLPADIFLGSHGSFFDLQRKVAERGTTADSAAPFIDREGYRGYVDRSEAAYRRFVTP